MSDSRWTAGLPVEADLPQTDRKDPPGYHEAIWTWGYDRDAQAGFYLYLLHDTEDEQVRHEHVILYLPDDGYLPHGTLLSGRSRGRRSAGRTAAGDGLAVTCIEPFRRWETRYEGALQRVAWDDASPVGDPVAVRLAFTMDAAAPAWNVEGTWGEPPPNMRFHQLYRFDGELVVGDNRVPVRGSTMRGHSRRQRDNSAYTGHVMATALFDDGRAFGMFCFFGEGIALRRPQGYVALDGVVHEATVEEVPPVRRPAPSGEPLRFVLRGDFGDVVVTGETVVTSCAVRSAGDQVGLVTSMGIARYEWDGSIAYGPIDRAHTAEVLEI